MALIALVDCTAAIWSNQVVDLICNPTVTLMKPIRQHILFCTGSDCKKRGNKKAYKNAKAALKDAGQPFARCSQTQCLGACKHAPVMAVYPHGNWYSGVTSKDDLRDLFETQIEQGQPLKAHCIHQMDAAASDKSRK